MRTIVTVLTALLLASPAAADEKLGSYIFSRGHHSSHVRILNHDWPVGINMDEPFFWFSYGDRTYVIRDAVPLQRVSELFAPMHELAPQRRERRARLRPLEKKQRALERESSRWERRLDRGESREAEQRIEELERQIEEVEAQIETLEPEEEALDAQEERLESEAEEKLVPFVEQAIRSGAASPKS